MLVFILLPVSERTAERAHIYSHIECDVCETRAPSSEESGKQGGLIGMGWYIDGGRHRCPEHFHEDTAPHGPQYRDA